jgi:hypothetical protein
MVIYPEIYGNKFHGVIIRYIQPEVPSSPHSTNTLKVLIALTGKRGSWKRNWN